MPQRVNAFSWFGPCAPSRTARRTCPAVTSSQRQATAEKVAKAVLTHRSAPPDFGNIPVEELTGDRPFENLDAVISQEELRASSGRYNRVAGYGLDALA